MSARVIPIQGLLPMSPGALVKIAGNLMAELPPVHPRCRVFDQEYLQAYANKLNASKDSTGMIRLREALQKAMSQPPQGAWHQFAPGWVGCTHIIPLHFLRRLNAVQMTKLGVCGCRNCRITRGVN